ncbi:MazG nucleotide pyrophosphohydrolase domain-containing protein [Kribbella sindirgiensis]|uniref:Nucleotide pyrophosphohydrolase n=1 Tax=Kribbella sindirgiensis TaxID=1124744 RepID=A0A4R0IMQ2_9ACTN|nr:MazG nucleotide pyrophosphohydrolase domain-containing protein [Kribbella sindirgiensis]TCC34893.1 nucleotide pyrophosphohydrolase [Kribbella sindirgiensis]
MLSYDGDPPGASGSPDDLRAQVRRFAGERGWDEISAPAALLLNLVAETGELAQLFRWLSPSEAAARMADQRFAADVRCEMGDIYWSILRLADVLDVDLTAALLAKLELLAERHPRPSQGTN